MILKKLFPPLGHRIIKTAMAVFICLAIHIAVGYRGSVSSAAIAAIICMQPYVSDTKTYAIERVIGTLHGSLWGFAFLLIMSAIPAGGKAEMLIAYSLMALFVLLGMYAAVVIKQASTAALVAIVFLSMVIEYPNIDTTPVSALGTLLDTMCGTIIAVTVNVSHLPRKRHPEKLFFVRTMDLTPDRYKQIPSAVHIILDHLYNDGAKVCLISRWAPAFVISQMGLLNVSAPVIVMDGAAIYDMSENKYLDVIEIPKENAEKLCDIITGFGTFCSFYTVRDRSLCIYRSGPISDAEREEYEKMKRSPYRNYLEGSFSDEDRIAFIRVIDTPERIIELSYMIRSVLPPGMFRMDIRQEAQFQDYMGIYFYAPEATADEMKKRVLGIMEKRCGMELTPVDMLPKLSNYLPEHDALILLNRLKNAYEPVDLFAFFKKKNR